MILLIGFKWLIHGRTFTGGIWKGTSFAGTEGKQHLRMRQAHFWDPLNNNVCNMECKWWWRRGKWRLESRRVQSTATGTQKLAKTMALNNLKSHSWEVIKGVILWIRIIAELVTRVIGCKESVCWGEGICLVEWRAWCKALCLDTRMKGQVPRATKCSKCATLGKVAWFIQRCSCPHHYKNDDSKAVLAGTQLRGVWDICTGSFIKALTSGFSLAFFMMFLQSPSMAW